MLDLVTDARVWGIVLWGRRSIELSALLLLYGPSMTIDHQSQISSDPVTNVKPSEFVGLGFQ
jgi:hypothetical protein